MAIGQHDLATITDFQGLARLFYRELGWPRERWEVLLDTAERYEIPRQTLPGIEQLALVGRMSSDQTWGVLLVDYGGNPMNERHLRRILRQVADGSRSHHGLPTWPLDRILFIIRHRDRCFTLGHFRGDRVASATWRTFGWTEDPATLDYAVRNLPRLAWSDQDDWASAWDADISGAFDRFLAEIEAELDHLTRKLEEAAQGRQYERISALNAKAKAIVAFKSKLDQLRAEWLEITKSDSAPDQDRPSSSEAIARPERTARREKGEITPSTYYWEPILSELIARGGSESSKVVLEAIYERVKDRLTPLDLEILPGPREQRWRNNARWARKHMVEEGLLEKESPKGTWTISDEGRRWIRARSPQ